jgi:hypothetical protein
MTHQAWLGLRATVLVLLVRGATERPNEGIQQTKPAQAMELRS